MSFQIPATPAGHIAKHLGHKPLHIAGHDVTERYGIKALGEFLALKFDLAYRFLEPIHYNIGI